MVYTNYIIACDNLNVCRPMYPDTNIDYNNITNNLYNSLYYMPLALFYTMVGFGYVSLINYIKKSENKYIYQYKSLSELKILENYTNGNEGNEGNEGNKGNDGNDGNDENKNLPNLNNVEVESIESTNDSNDSDVSNDFDDSDDSNKTNETNEKIISILDNMLSTKTVERALVLYYIFVFKGNYLVKRIEKYKNGLGEDIEEEIIEEYNSFKEFNNMESIIESKNTDYDTYNLFNLDETLLPDTKLKIGEKEYNINQAHLNFISWLYYSGIYDYITKNKDLKFNILNEMNEQKLLRGNVFLRYQLQLLEKAAPKL